MDCSSEQYIKMRIKAIPDLGMGDEPFALKLPYFVTDKVWVAPNGNFYCHHNLGKEDVIIGCQLERQDQLQAMINDQPENPKHIINKLYAFADFVHKKPYVPKGFETQRGLPEEGDEACHYFDSMEQLWLAFVMKEKYNKVWNGEDWQVNKRDEDDSLVSAR